ncbi:MAG: hypothetical protein JWP75_3519 [Frondihabitans sp.]|nr:hypothetical protein [Frondihabitans sp.]
MESTLLHEDTMNSAPALIVNAIPADAALPGVVATQGRVCEGAAYHSPTPLLLHEVELENRTVLLCGNLRGNLAVLHTLLRADNELPWTVKRSFGNRLRSLLWSPEAQLRLLQRGRQVGRRAGPKDPVVLGSGQTDQLSCAETGHIHAFQGWCFS